MADPERVASAPTRPPLGHPYPAGYPYAGTHPPVAYYLSPYYPVPYGSPYPPGPYPPPGLPGVFPPAAATAGRWQRRGSSPPPLKRKREDDKEGTGSLSKKGSVSHDAESKHAAFSQLLSAIVGELSRFNRPKKAQNGAEKDKSEAETPLSKDQKKQLEQLLEQRWHLEYFKRYVDTTFTRTDDPDLDGVEVPEFDTQLVHLKTVLTDKRRAPAGWALEITRKNYHPDWGFYSQVRIRVTSDLMMTVQVNWQPFLQREIVNFHSFSEVVERMSRCSHQQPCSGLRDFQHYTSVLEPTDTHFKSEFPEPDVAHSSECEIWFKPPVERQGLPTRCQKCREFKEVLRARMVEKHGEDTIGDSEDVVEENEDETHDSPFMVGDVKEESRTARKEADTNEGETNEERQEGEEEANEGLTVLQAADALQMELEGGVTEGVPNKEGVGGGEEGGEEAETALAMVVVEGGEGAEGNLEELGVAGDGAVVVGLYPLEREVRDGDNGEDRGV